MTESAENLAQFTARDQTLLIVDDNPANLAVLSDHLEACGFRILVAQNGEKALQRAQRIRPDIILLDVLMPGIDGFETCRRLKADERTRDIPVIFMTVLSNTEDKVRGFDLGAVDYVTKPLMPDEVLARITTHLRIQHLTRELLQARDELEERVRARTAELARANEKLRHYRENLEALVEERTAELKETNAQLEREIAERRRAEQELKRHATLLEAANQELEAFSYSVSHDLRAPLRAIDGFAQIMLKEYDSVLDTEGQRLLSVITGSTRKMQQLIDDLLVFSRMGRQAMNLVEVDMETLARHVFQELEAGTPDRELHFTVGPLPPARGDRAMMRQVWVNLLSNALKFTAPREMAVIEVGSRVVEGETVYYVKDNGVGFDMQYLDKLFGVFQRLHGVEEFEGTGVGLALVQRIIHRHGGQVWAEGKVDEGATFYFTLAEE